MSRAEARRSRTEGFVAEYQEKDNQEGAGGKGLSRIEKGWKGLRIIGKGWKGLERLSP